MYGIFTYICHKNQWNVGKLDGTGVDVHIRRRFPTQGRFHPPTKGTGRHRSDGMTWILRSRTKSFGVDAEIRVIGRVLAHKLPVLLSTHYQYILKRCITVYHYRIHMMILWIYIYIYRHMSVYTHTIYTHIIALLEISQCKFPFSNGSKSFSFSLSPASHCLRGSGRSDRGEEHFGIPLDPICSGYSSEFFSTCSN